MAPLKCHSYFFTHNAEKIIIMKKDKGEVRWAYKLKKMIYSNVKK